MSARKLYTPEQKQFFFDYVPGHTNIEVAEEFKRRFDRELSPRSVKNYKARHHIKSGTPKGWKKGQGGPVWSLELCDFVREHNKGKTAQEMADLINKEFNTDFNATQVKGVRARLKLDSGLTGHFQKGHVSHNKGKKGLRIPGSEKGWFQKGHRPWNTMKVGDETWSTDGYLKIKIAEPDKWKHKHLIEWEKHNGAVPEGYMVTFRNGDHADCSIENLVLISKAEHAIMNCQHLRSETPELTDTGIMLARLKHTISTKEKEERK